MHGGAIHGLRISDFGFWLRIRAQFASGFGFGIAFRISSAFVRPCWHLAFRSRRIHITLLTSCTNAIFNALGPIRKPIPIGPITEDHLQSSNWSSAHLAVPMTLHRRSRDTSQKSCGSEQAHCISSTALPTSKALDLLSHRHPGSLLIPMGGYIAAAQTVESVQTCTRRWRLRGERPHTRRKMAS